MNTASFERTGSRIMVLLHAVGVTGILAGYGQYFLDFTAVNLLVNGVLAFGPIGKNGIGHGSSRLPVESPSKSSECRPATSLATTATARYWGPWWLACR